MAANAINISAPTTGPAGPGVPAGPNAAALAANPLAGFEALLAAMFPQPAQVAAATGPAAAAASSATPPPTPPAATPAIPAANLISDPTSGDTAEDTAKTLADATADGAEAAEAVDVVDPDAALAVCLLPTPVVLTDVPAKAPAGETLDNGPLPGRLRPQVPFNAAPPQQAAPAGKDELAPEAALEGNFADATDTLRTPRSVAGKAAESHASAPPAWGRDKPAGTPAAPALQNANPKAELAAKAEPPVADLPPPPAASPTASAVETPALAAVAAPAVRPDATPAPGRTAKAGKAERAKGVDETAAASDLKAPVMEKPATARAATAVGKTASAEGEAAETAAHAPKVEADQPEPVLLAETRAAADASAPLAHAAHIVRGAPETVANLAAQIVKKLEAKTTRFDVELDPLGLGKVNVRVEIGAQGALTAAMSFDNPQAAAELRGRAAELQKALEQAGFNLAGGLTFDVAGERGQQQHHGQAWQDQGEAAGRAFRGQAFRAALDTAGDAAQAATNGALRLRRGVTAGLDVRI